MSEIAAMEVSPPETLMQVPQAVELHRTHLQMLIREPDEDWTGITDRIARKKLQNKLNQRAQRKSLISITCRRQMLRGNQKVLSKFGALLFDP